MRLDTGVATASVLAICWRRMGLSQKLARRAQLEVEIESPLLIGSHGFGDLVIAGPRFGTLKGF